jgi:hypothetical protein
MHIDIYKYLLIICMYILVMGDMVVDIVTDKGIYIYIHVYMYV